MPIQIRELIVTATVDETQQILQAPRTASEAAANTAQMNQALVQTCVEEVLKVIKQQGRR